MKLCSDIVFSFCASVSPDPSLYFSPGLSPKNSEIWVGAWWLGFVICSCIALCTVIPLYGFPRELPGTAKIRAEKKSEAFGESAASGEEVAIKRSHFFKNLKIVVCNPTFIFLSLSSFAESKHFKFEKQICSIIYMCMYLWF